jgi:hypothetical protein
MEQYVQINKVDSNMLPRYIAKSTLYKWQRENRYPNMFKRIGGKVLINIIALINLLEYGE